MDLGHLLELNAWELIIEFKTEQCFSLTTLFSMDPCTPHIWLVRLLFQSEQCFPLTTFQSEQCFSVNFSQDSVSRTGPKCTAWWSPKRKNDRCQRGDNLKQAYFIKVPIRGIQMPYFETLWFPNQAANVYLPCGIFKAYSFKMRKNVECIYHCRFQAHIRQVILHTVSREAIST